MIRSPEVAQNFAQALFQVAKKRGLSLDELRDEAVGLRQILETRPRFRVFFEGPQFRDEDKEQVAAKAFKGNISDLFYLFIIQLLRHDRIDYLLDIVDEFERLVLNEQGFTACTVITAVALDEAQQNALQQKLEAYCGRRFLMRYRVEPEILGGVQVRYADMLMDTSLKTTLSSIRNRLRQAKLPKMEASNLE